jgi:hypothetical protein
LVNSLQRNQSEDADKSYRKIIQASEENHIPKDTMPTTPTYSISEEEDEVTGTFYVWENSKIIYTVHYFKDEEIEKEVMNWNMALGIAYEYCEEYIINKNKIKINLK